MCLDGHSYHCKLNQGHRNTLHKNINGQLKNVITKITKQPVSSGDVFLNEDRSVRADGSLSLMNQEIIWDVGIADPTAPYHTNHNVSSATNPLGAAIHYAKIKEAKYTSHGLFPLPLPKSLHFVIFDSSGALGPDAIKFCKLIIQNRSPGISKSTAKQYWRYFKRVITSLCLKTQYICATTTHSKLIAVADHDTLENEIDDEYNAEPDFYDMNI
jgi:hypothetical protein